MNNGDPEDSAQKKLNLYFNFQFRTCANLLSSPLSHDFLNLNM